MGRGDASEGKGEEVKWCLIAAMVCGCGSSQSPKPSGPKFNRDEAACALANEAKYSPELAACETEACIDDVTAEHNAADARCIDEN